MKSSLYAFCQFVGLKKKIKHEGVFKLTPPHAVAKCLTLCEQENNLQEYFGRVPGGTRTHDIQNHKQSCECLINPVLIGVSAIFDFLFAAILRLFTQGPILFFNKSRNLLMQNRRFTIEPIIVIIKTNYYSI